MRFTQHWHRVLFRYFAFSGWGVMKVQAISLFAFSIFKKLVQPFNFSFTLRWADSSLKVCMTLLPQNVNLTKGSYLRSMLSVCFLQLGFQHYNLKARVRNYEAGWH